MGGSMHDDSPEGEPRSDRADRSPFEALVEYVRGRTRTLREDDSPQFAAADGDSPDGDAFDGDAPSADRHAWVLAVVAFAGLTVFNLVWALVHSASVVELAVIVSWPALGLVVAIVVGRRWAGAWALYLLWAAPWVVGGVAALLTPLFGPLSTDLPDNLGDLPSSLVDTSLNMPAAAALVAGALLCYAAARQGVAWSSALAIRHPEQADAAAARAVVVGAGVVLFGYAIAEASVSGLIDGSWSLAGSRDVLIVTVVAVVALLVERLPRAAVWVFAIAGVCVAAEAVQSLVRLPWLLGEEGVRSFGGAWAALAAVALAGVAQLVWAGFVLYAARRQYELTRPGTSQEVSRLHADPRGDV
jgi:hypothetical protein